MPILTTLLLVATMSAPPLLQNVHTIVCLGDSITQQGASPTGYVTRLQQALTKALPDQNIKIINVGIGGQKAPDMRKRFQKDVLDNHPDLVTISVGVNDVWHGFNGHPKGDGPAGNPLPIYRSEIQAMLDMAKAKNLKVVLLSPTPIHENLKNLENKKLNDYVKTMAELAKLNRATFIDLYHPFLQAIDAYQKRAGTGQNLLTTDGVHMAPAGDRLMSHQILLGLGIDKKWLAEQNL